jgi:hypothetical protein
MDASPIVRLKKLEARIFGLVQTFANILFDRALDLGEDHVSEKLRSIDEILDDRLTRVAIGGIELHKDRLRLVNVVSDVVFVDVKDFAQGEGNKEGRQHVLGRPSVVSKTWCALGSGKVSCTATQNFSVDGLQTFADYDAPVVGRWMPRFTSIGPNPPMSIPRAGRNGYSC